MPSEITMPQLSDTMSEGTVVKWHKKEGEAVKAGEEIADIETDKATMPMEAFDSGTLAYIAAGEGQKVKVGGLLAVIAAPGENVEEIRTKAKSGAGAVSAPAAGAAVAAAQAQATKSPDVETDHPRMEAQRGEARQAQAAPHPGEAAPAAPKEGERVRISPLARRIAADKGVDLSNIKGSGPGGRIVERDVLEALAGTGAAPARAMEAPPVARAAPAPAPKPFTPIVSRGQKEVVTLTKMRAPSPRRCCARSRRSRTITR